MSDSEDRNQPIPVQRQQQPDNIKCLKKNLSQQLKSLKGRGAIVSPEFSSSRVMGNLLLK